MKRIGPHIQHVDIDDDGNPLDHWRVVGQVIAVEELGSDNQFHYAQATIGLHHDGEILESFFAMLERALEHKMIKEGVWVGN